MTNMPFAKLITEHRGGDLEEACSAALAEILGGIREHGGKGELALKLVLKQNEYGMIEVKADVKHKAPKPALKPSIFWLTDDGLLTRRDPNQTDIEDIPGVKRQLAAVPQS